MKRIKTIIILSVMISLLIPFISFGAREGMGSVESNSKKQVWIYHTAEEDEYGNSVYLKNQWKQMWDCWYYFGEDGKSLHNTWAEIDGKWYYFDQWSVMLHDTITPDGYTVGSDGAWIQEEAVQ